MISLWETLATTRLMFVLCSNKVFQIMPFYSVASSNLIRYFFQRINVVYAAGLRVFLKRVRLHVVF